MLFEDYEEIYGKNQALEKWCIDLVRQLTPDSEASGVPNKEKKETRKVLCLRKVSDGPREVLLPIHALKTQRGERVTCIDVGTGELFFLAKSQCTVE